MSLTLDPRTGLWSWKKGERVQLSKHFETHEFTCPCMFRTCLTQFVHRDLLARLDNLRDAVGAPIKINSGYRCQQHQVELLQSGYQATAGTSQHTLGHAADIQSVDIVPLTTEAEQLFKAIGTSHRWIHVDTRDDKVRRWSYQ